MSTISDPPDLDPCGCCEVEGAPLAIHNRPGLNALIYRIGTYPTFVRRMLNGLGTAKISDGPYTDTYPLNALTTRSTSDPAISLIDAWAIVADVLTFYQERIANEGYLRTATERRSVLELARTIGYELNPGVSAEAYLAFTVEDATGAPGVATVPQGTKVQSVPGQGQAPQTFETSTETFTRAEWNTLRPRLTRPQELAICEDNSNKKLYALAISTNFGAEPTPTSLAVNRVYPLDANIFLPTSGSVKGVEVKQIDLVGTTTNLKLGDLILLVGSKIATDLKTLPRVVQTLPRVVQRLEVDVALNRTRVILEKEETFEPPKPPTFQPLPYIAAPLVLSSVSFNQASIRTKILQQTWRERDLTAFIAIQRDWSRRSLVRFVNITPPPPSPSSLPPANPGVFRFGAKLGIFGHNAPLYGSLPSQSGNNIQNLYNNWDDSSAWEIWKDSLKSSNVPRPSGSNPGTPSYYSNSDIYLERTVPGMVNNTWVVLESPENNYEDYRVEQVAEESLAGFSLSSKVTGLKLSKNGSKLLNKSTHKPTQFTVRKTTAYVQSERLILAELPIIDPLTKGITQLQLSRMVIGLQIGQPVILTGELDDLPGITRSEVVLLSDIEHSGGYTQLTFKEGLQNTYIRKTVTLNANVAKATHGETVTEILGSGNGAKPNQRFKLKKTPLTYVSAATTSGAQSTLQVRVNGVLWAETPRLYGLNARSEDYMVRLEDDGTTQVIFGDGTVGARLPTGAENVVATYRSGIGLAGILGADKLTLLQTRPLGIRTVTNPLSTLGAAEPENRDEARSNAPLTVLTLDRIVSLQDFEDFARAFAGIGKAQAIVLQEKRNRIVQSIIHITVAAAAAIAPPDEDEVTPALASHEISETADLFKHLVTAIGNASDPSHEFVVKSYKSLFFNLKAKVLINPRHLAAEVLVAVSIALKDAFAFEKRSFGQPVTAAEIIKIIQLVPGVIATDLVQLYRYVEGQMPPDPNQEEVKEILSLDRVKQRNDAAQLLLINPVGIVLEEMKA